MRCNGQKESNGRTAAVDRGCIVMPSYLQGRGGVSGVGHIFTVLLLIVNINIIKKQVSPLFCFGFSGDVPE